MRAPLFVSSLVMVACASAPPPTPVQTTSIVSAAATTTASPAEDPAPHDAAPILELGAVAKLDGEPLCPKGALCRQYAESGLILPLIAKIKTSDEIKNGLTILVDPALAFAPRYERDADPAQVSLSDVLISFGNQNARGFTLGAANDARRWKVVLSGVDVEGPTFRLTNEHTTHVSRGGPPLDATCRERATTAVLIDIANLKPCLDSLASQKPWTTINFYPQPEQKMNELFSIFAMLPADSAISIAP